MNELDEYLWILTLSNYNLLSWSCVLYKTCWHTDTHSSIHMCNAGSTWTPVVPLKPSVKFKSVHTGATPLTQMQLDKAAIELDSSSHFLELLQWNINSSNLQRPVCENYPKIFIGNSWIWKAEKRPCSCVTHVLRSRNCAPYFGVSSLVKDRALEFKFITLPRIKRSCSHWLRHVSQQEWVPNQLHAHWL